MKEHTYMPYNYFFFCLASRIFPQHIQPADAENTPAPTPIHADGAGGVEPCTKLTCLLN